MVDSEMKRTPFDHKILDSVAKCSATVKTQRCLTTSNISRNHVDQNGGY